MAVAATLAALLARVALNAFFHSEPFYTPFYPAVLVAAWYGGIGPGLTATLLSAGSGGYLWLEAGVGPAGPTRWLYIGGGFAVMLVIVSFCEQLRRDRRRADDKTGALARVERALRDSEAQLRRIFETASVGIAEIDARGTWARVNPALCAMLGVGADAPLGRPVDELTHPEDRDAVRTRLEALLRGEIEQYNIEQRFVAGDGHTIRADVRVAHQAGEGGRGRFICVVTDVTLRKEAEEQLRRSEQAHLRELTELENVYQASPLGLALLDRELRFLRINAAMADLLGAPAARHIGRTLRDAFPSTADALEPLYRRVLERGEPILGLDVHVATAAEPHRESDWRVYCYPMSDSKGRITAVGSIVEEVTDRVRMMRHTLFLSDLGARLVGAQEPAETLRSGLARIRSYLRAGRCVWAELDERGSPLFVEQAPPPASATPALALPALGEQAMRVLRSGRALSVPDARAAPELGRELCAALDARSLLALSRPLDEERRAALFVAGEQPHEWSEDERNVVAAAFERLWLALENARLYAQVRDRDRRKDEFLAMLAHELRNPLGPIANAAQILEGLAEGDERLERPARVVGRQAHHLGRLLEDLLDVARVSRGVIELHPAPLDLTDVVTQAAENARPELEARRQRLELSLPEEPVPVRGDADRLVQALFNLLDNASKYTPEAGLIRVREERSDGEARVSVEDTGAGIAPEVLPHVFDLFVQGPASLDRSDGGMGVGLHLVAHLVEKHGGRVEARSAGPGRGSEFVVRLPAARLPVEPADSARGGAAEPEPGLRILVVDDHPDSASSLAALLEGRGHAARPVSDGRAALREARSWHPDVAVVDIGLPGMDGYEVARRLREGENDDLRLIALTGYGDEDARRRSAESGFDAHLLKPVDLRALLHALRG